MSAAEVCPVCGRYLVRQSPTYSYCPAEGNLAHIEAALELRTSPAHPVQGEARDPWVTFAEKWGEHAYATNKPTLYRMGYEDGTAHAAAEVEQLKAARRAFLDAKVGLAASLDHNFEACSGGIAPHCFVCEGLRAVMEQLGEIEPRRLTEHGAEATG